MNNKKYVIYLLFFEKNLFKIGKSLNHTRRIKKLQNEWGIIENAVIIEILNGNNETMDSFERILHRIIRTRPDFEEYSKFKKKKKDGYKEIYKYKDKRNVINKILKYSEEISKMLGKTIKIYTTENKLKEEIDISSLIPQQISLIHIIYFFYLKNSDLLTKFKEENKKFEKYNTEYKKKLGISSRNPKTIKQLNIKKFKKEFPLMYILEFLLKKHGNKTKIDKSNNSRTYGYVKTFVNNYSEKFDIVVELDIKFFLNQLLNNKENLCNIIEENFSKVRFSKTTNKRRGNIREWYKKNLKFFNNNKINEIINDINYLYYNNKKNINKG